MQDSPTLTLQRDAGSGAVLGHSGSLALPVVLVAAPSVLVLPLPPVLPPALSVVSLPPVPPAPPFVEVLLVVPVLSVLSAELSSVADAVVAVLVTVVALDVFELLAESLVPVAALTSGSPKISLLDSPQAVEPRAIQAATMSGRAAIDGWRLEEEKWQRASNFGI